MVPFAQGILGRVHRLRDEIGSGVAHFSPLLLLAQWAGPRKDGPEPRPLGFGAAPGGMSKPPGQRVIGAAWPFRPAVLAAATAPLAGWCRRDRYRRHDIRQCRICSQG